MRITHLGHSCVLLESADTRILIDPGNFSQGWDELAVDAVLVTHQHADHADPQRLPAFLATRPEAFVAVEASVVEHVELPGSPRLLEAGETFQIGPFQIETVGGLHAVIHRDLPRVHNVGLVITADDTTVFHPGDSLDTAPEGVDLALIPMHAPWSATREVIDFARAVKAPKAVLIHDGLLNPTGYDMVKGHVSRLGGVEVVDLRDHQPWEIPGRD